MPHLPPGELVDGSVSLPGASSRSFWLNGSAWEYPDFENVDTFVERLVYQGLLFHEPAVRAVLQDTPPRRVSIRSLQRYFRQVTGLTQASLRQIERARYAVLLLQQGTPILEAVHLAGYFDQPHLTRSLAHYIGQTPAQILRDEKRKQLSFLYKTNPFGPPTIRFEDK
jgi:AraC-like DNA-binding protein